MANDTLNITGGTIEGDISGGNDTNTCTIDPGGKHSFTYAGAISDFDIVEIKSGVVTFFGASTYTGKTFVRGGTFFAVNSTGSATGSSDVLVTGGTLSGNGSIDGTVTIGGGDGSAALAPGVNSQKEATLTIKDTLTFETGGIYLYGFKADRNHSSANQVIANGVTIDSAITSIDGKIGGRLFVGTTFILINNTAVTPIYGTFSNLPDGSVITIHGNYLQASYAGGDGNDLTLSVVP
jgi:autotransporter-associated beta strand protein